MPIAPRLAAARPGPRSSRLLVPFALLLLRLAVPLSAQLADGSSDPTFGANGLTIVPFDLGDIKADHGSAVAHLAGDRLLLAGSVTTGAVFLSDLAVAQILWNGSPDATFGGGDGRVNHPFGVTVGDLVAAAVTSQGKVVLAGSVYWTSTDADFLVVRLLSDGSLDPGFGGGDGWVSIPFDVNPGGDPIDSANSLFVTPSDKIVVAGSAKRSATNTDFAVAMLTAGGALDPSFGGGTGKRIVPFDAGGWIGHDHAVAVFPSADGAIVLAGASEQGPDGDFDFAVAEIDYGGDLVASFGFGGKATLAFDLVPGGSDWAYDGGIDPQGRILLAGTAEGASNRYRAAVGCLTTSGSGCGDFGSAARVTFSFSPSPQGDEEITGIACDDLGRLVFAGTAVPSSSANRDIAVGRLLRDGTLDSSFGPGNGIRVFDLHHGTGSYDDEAVRLALVAGKPLIVGSTEYDEPDRDFFALRIWVSLLQADGFERGTHEGWTSHAP